MTFPHLPTIAPLTGLPLTIWTACDLLSHLVWVLGGGFVLWRRLTTGHLRGWQTALVVTIGLLMLITLPTATICFLASL